MDLMLLLQLAAWHIRATVTPRGWWWQWWEVVKPPGWIPSLPLATLDEHPHLARPVFSSRNGALELLLSQARRMN